MLSERTETRSSPPSPTYVGKSATQAEFLQLIASPFDSQISSASFLSALAFYGTSTILILIAFGLIRPRYRDVYEGRRMRSTEVSSSTARRPFEWLLLTIRTTDAEVREQSGLDAVIFVRFTRMVRNLFILLTIIACAALLPANLHTAVPASFPDEVSRFSRLTPQYSSGSPLLWTYVAVAYTFNGIVCAILWLENRAIARLKRATLQSQKYQSSLHARTLLIYDIPPPLQSDGGVSRLADNESQSAIGRDITGLEKQVEKHNNLVGAINGTRQGENSRDRSKAAEVVKLKSEIEAIRRSPEQLRAMPYGFATYRTAAEVCDKVYQHRHGGPGGTSIRRATEPDNLIWRNLSLSQAQRRRQRWINGFHITLLTLAWLVPNVFIAVFLSNLSHLALIWPSLRSTLHNHPTLWGVVQGIVPPAITALFYFYLPAILRRFVTNAGDMTKSDRERHVMQKLFSFYLFNQLIAFSLFSTLWAFGAAFVHASRSNNKTWTAVVRGNMVEKITLALVTVSPYWCCWLVQRNLGLSRTYRPRGTAWLTAVSGVAVDLIQLMPLLLSVVRRRFRPQSSQTHAADDALRTFDYAAQYSYYLFYTAVALTFGVLQPLALAVTAIYFGLDAVVKKYMLLHMSVTKHESYGAYWQSLFDRVLINTALGDVVVALLVAAQGPTGQRWGMLAAILPLPGLLAAFKWYCANTFAQTMCHDRIEKVELSNRGIPRGIDWGTGERFQHPALMDPLAAICTSHNTIDGSVSERPKLKRASQRHD